MAVSRILAASSSLIANCAASDAIGDCVYVTADRVGGLYQVTKVNPRVLTQIPSIGVIEAKPTATTCIVRSVGLLVGIYVGLTVQAQLWVGLDGKLTSNQAGITAPPAGSVAVQPMGIAVASDVVLLHPQAPVIRRG